MDRIKDNLVSIIIPVYKVEKYIHRCVDSVINQTYQNLEIILVDDGSPDNCPSICDEYAMMDNRITAIHKANGGLSDARNYGISMASGDYIMLVDSDDYIKHNMVELMLNRIINDDSDLAMCNYICVDEKGNEDCFGIENSLPISDEVIDSSQAQKKLFGKLNWHYVIACCKLYKKELFDNFQYPLGKLHEDLFTTHLIFDKCKKISCINEGLYYYFQNSESITHVYNIRRLDAIDAYKNRYDFYMGKGDYHCANMCLYLMVEKISLAYKKLDLKDKKNKLVIKKYHNIFRTKYRDFKSNKCKIEYRNVLNMFYLSDKLYDLYMFFINLYSKISHN